MIQPTGHSHSEASCRAAGRGVGAGVGDGSGAAAVSQHALLSEVDAKSSNPVLFEEIVL